MLKLQRKVLFSSNIDFYGSSSNNDEKMHPDEYKRLGCQEFKRKSMKITVTEINLDQKVVQQEAQAKEAAAKEME